MFLRFADATLLESRVKGMGYANGLTLEIEIFILSFILWKCILILWDLESNVPERMVVGVLVGGGSLSEGGCIVEAVSLFPKSFRTDATLPFQRNDFIHPEKWCLGQMAQWQISTAIVN